MTADNRVVLDYTNRDYKSIRAMLVGLAQGFLPEWVTAGETGDFGTLLLELFAYNGDIMNYYIDRVGAEAFLGTASRRQSVMFIADMLGYTPVGQQAATVPLSFTWQWDSANTQVSNTIYKVIKTRVENGVAYAQVSNPDSPVQIDVGQAVTLSDIPGPNPNPFAGTYVVESFTPATDTDPAIISIILPDQYAPPVDEDTLTEWVPAPAGLMMTTGSIVIVPAKTIVSSVPDEFGQSVAFETDSDVILDSTTATKVSTPGFVGALADDPSTTYSVVAVGTATEGVTVDPVSIGISKGIPNSDLALNDIGIIDNSVSVFTKEGGAVVSWSRIDNLAVAGPDQSVFAYYVDDQGLTHIIFGDNASGRVPPVNCEIFVSYRVGVGSNANSLDIGTVTTLNNDFASGMGVTVANTASPTGGSDVETIESMRFSIPRSNAVRRRAVSLDDYNSLALQVPGVTKAIAYGDSYTSVFVRIAASAQSRAYITDRVPYIKTGSPAGTIKVITQNDHSSDLHPGDIVYLDTQNATGSFPIRRVWQAQPTNPIGITKKKLNILSPSDYPNLMAPQSSARITCAVPHGLIPGQPVKVEGLGSPYDGVWVVGSVPDEDRKVFTYHCPQFIQPDTSVDATILNYTTPLAEVSVADGEASCTAYSGLELYDKEARRGGSIGLHLYHPTGIPALGDSPNLSFSDPQMRALISAVESYLADKDLVGAKVYAEPVEWTNVRFDIDVTVRDLYNRTSVRDAVVTALTNVFDFDNVDFGQKITLGEVYRAALAVDGVEFVSINSMYISDPSVSDTGVVVAASPSVGDIVTPSKNIPRLDPSLDTTTALHVRGGLVNT